MDLSAENSKRRSPDNERQYDHTFDFLDPDVLVAFIVGEDYKKFLIHKEVVDRSSPILKAAFESQFVEVYTQTYVLDDITERAFRLLMAWMYTKQIPIRQLQGLENADAIILDTKVIEDEDSSLAELWVLSDKLRIPRLQNLAIETMAAIGHVSRSRDQHNMLYIYNNTSPGSALRRFKIAELADKVTPESLSLFTPENVPFEFLRDMVVFSSKKNELAEHVDLSRIYGGR